MVEVAAAPAVVSAAPAKSGWRKWLGVGVIVIMAAVAALLLLPKDNKQAKLNSPEAKTDSATKVQAAPATAPPAAAVHETVKAEAAKAKARMDSEAEALRLQAEKKQADALATAAKLKADAEAEAKEKERQAAETVRIEKEREAARELQEQQRKMAEAKKNIEQICAAYLQGRCELTVFDVCKDFITALDHGVLLTPTLLLLSPLPSVTIIGNLSDTEKVLGALRLPKANNE